uniref:Putative secreted protein n=1 Tax=Anopheles triannulatus TaxID=58253 RepID=A0A2M4B516_9DIPT
MPGGVMPGPGMGSATLAAVLVTGDAAIGGGPCGTILPGGCAPASDFCGALADLFGPDEPGGPLLLLLVENGTDDLLDEMARLVTSSVS